MSVRVLDKEGLRALIGRLSGLSDSATSWGLDPQAAIGDQDRARVVLEVFSMAANGVDEHRRALNPPGYPAGAFVTTELGNRDVVITVRAEAFDGGVEAAEILDSIHTGIRTEASTQTLNGLSLAFVQAERASAVKYQVDTRVVNAAIADFTFAGVAQLVSDIEINQGWIDTVNTNNVVPGTLT